MRDDDESRRGREETRRTQERNETQRAISMNRETLRATPNTKQSQTFSLIRPLMSAFFCTASSRPSPRTAASPPPRRAVGAFGPVLTNDPERIIPIHTKATTQIASWAADQSHCGSTSRTRDAAVKGALRQPSAALDRRSLRARAPSPVRHFRGLPAASVRRVGIRDF